METFPAIFSGNKTGYFSQEVGPSMSTGDQNRYFKPNHDASLTYMHSAVIKEK